MKEKKTRKLVCNVTGRTLFATQGKAKSGKKTNVKVVKPKKITVEEFTR